MEIFYPPQNQDQRKRNNCTGDLKQMVRCISYIFKYIAVEWVESEAKRRTFENEKKERTRVEKVEKSQKKKKKRK